MTPAGHPGTGGLFDALRVGVLVLCAEQRVVLCNEWLRQASPSPIDVGRRFEDVFPTLRGTRLHRSVAAVLEKRQPVMLSHALNRAPLPLSLGGSPVEQKILLVPVDGERSDPQCLIQVFDVTAVVRRERVLREKTAQAKQAEAKLVAANAELERIASSDVLTGTWNRRCFDETFDREWRRLARERGPLSLIMLDIDHFKRFNDDFGHQSGDVCLRFVAEVLGRGLSRPADILARYGGEEFVVLLPNTPLSGARHVAERLRATVCAAPPPKLPAVTISLGVACAHPPEGSPDGLLGDADDALYAAKARGRNQVRWAGDDAPERLSA